MMIAELKTFIWILNGSILSVAKSYNESDAWELLKNNNDNVYKALTGEKIIRPHTLESGCISTNLRSS